VDNERSLLGAEPQTSVGHHVQVDGGAHQARRRMRLRREQQVAELVGNRIAKQHSTLDAIPPRVRVNTVVENRRGYGS
jgi:ribosome-associated protein YbcJ (S4-like RNA binding protein)